MKRFLLLALLVLLFSLPAGQGYAWQKVPWKDKLLNMALGVGMTRGSLGDNGAMVDAGARFVPLFGLQTAIRPVCADLGVMFDGTIDLSAGAVLPLFSRFNGWFALSPLVFGRGAGREYKGTGGSRHDDRMEYTWGAGVRAEYLAYGGYFTVFVEARQTFGLPHEANIISGISVSPLIVLQMRESY